MPSYTHIYTGEGKGKSTASFGLIVRASGAGLKILLCQFIKKGMFSEIRSLRSLPKVTVRQFGTGCFIRGKPCANELATARKGFAALHKAAASGRYGLVVADELFPALKAGILTEKQIIKLIADKHPETELVLTGRDAPASVIARADLVTEMREIKHYWRKGVTARRGIEF